MTTTRATPRTAALAAALATLLLLSAPGCKDDADSARRGDGGPAQITASPNPLPPGSGTGTTTLTWRTGASGTAQVYVSVDGRPEKKVAEGHKGTKQIDWIRSGSDYQFKLYAGEDRQKVLATVAVRRPEPGGATAARPQQAAAGQRPAAGAQPAAAQTGTARTGAAAPAGAGGSPER